MKMLAVPGTSYIHNQPGGDAFGWRQGVHGFFDELHRLLIHAHNGVLGIVGFR